MKHINYIFIILIACLFLACGDGPDKKSTGLKKPPPPKKETKVTKSNTPVKAKSNNTSEGATPEQLEKAAAIIASVSETDVEAVNANKKFRMFCATCHGFTGDLNMNGAKDLTASKITLQESVAQVYHGKGLMTPFKGILSDAEIVAIAKHIESLRM